MLTLNLRLAVVQWLTSALVVLCLQPIVSAQLFENSIASTQFDLIRLSDANVFQALADEGTQRAEMPDKRSGRTELFGQARVFRATYSDRTSCRVYVSTALGNAGECSVIADRCARFLGRLPTVLRNGVERLVIHKGSEKVTAFSDVGLIVLYSGNIDRRIRDNDFEETLFHESVHAVWDQPHAVSKEWKRAQQADGGYVTHYAARRPDREDLAESSLFAFAMIHYPDRLPADVLGKLRKTISHRAEFVARLIPADRPLHFVVME